MTVHADSELTLDSPLDSPLSAPIRPVATPARPPRVPRGPQEAAAPVDGPPATVLVRQGLARLRAAAARRQEDAFPLRARQLIELCDHLQTQREVLMQAGWLAGYAPWDQRLDIDAGLQAVRALAQAPAQDWGDAALVVPRPPHSLPGDDTAWMAPVQTSAEGVDVLVLGLHRPAAHLLLGFARAWLAGRACLALSTESHPVLEALLPLMRSGLPHLGAILRWQVSDETWAASQVLPLLEGTDHVQIWCARTAGEPHPIAPPQGLAPWMRAPVAAGLAVVGEDVEPGSALFNHLADQIALGTLALQGLHERAVRGVCLPRAMVPAFAQALTVRWQDWQGSHPVTHWQSASTRHQHALARAWTQSALDTGARLLAGTPALPAALEVSHASAGAASGDLFGALARAPLGSPLLLWPYDAPEALSALLAGSTQGPGDALAILATRDERTRKDWCSRLARHCRVIHTLPEAPVEPEDHARTLRGAWALLASLDATEAPASLRELLPACTLVGGPQEIGGVLDTYLPGAAPQDVAVHPFRKHFEDLSVGDSLLTHRRTVTEADIAAFGGVSGDYFYMHFDAEAAAASPFGRRIAHGYFVLSAAAGLFVWPGPVLANYGLEHLRFIQPVGIGDTIQARLTCKRKQDRTRPGARRGQGVVAWDVLVTNQRGEAVLRYEILTLVARRDPGSAP
ncbi:MaoC/PaaZ C-terminal domain-containing protein [Pelomonas sp. APW6]|uniref:MaoC/PaaZ C-terminal domain-containing protein n=1 Tax=Roseateles subflavus TaxID=3053353 RepID=A0ABT7LKZ6_9BURK|nr:MaoC/PaaZ C-terminal domain-containing protein [Pelomonas sp. APW6]MDL5033541.1 MaoC/PaaZ C-terminal domain-containing protein [Pelomonas sp. APW6]